MGSVLGLAAAEGGLVAVPVHLAEGVVARALAGWWPVILRALADSWTHARRWFPRGFASLTGAERHLCSRLPTVACWNSCFYHKVLICLVELDRMSATKCLH
mgnify:CR=1 FL=1